MKKVSEKEGTGKLRSFWDNEMLSVLSEVVSVHKDLPTYQVQPAKGGCTPQSTVFV